MGIPTHIPACTAFTCSWQDTFKVNRNVPSLLAKVVFLLNIDYYPLKIFLDWPVKTIVLKCIYTQSRGASQINFEQYVGAFRSVTYIPYVLAIDWPQK